MATVRQNGQFFFTFGMNFQIFQDELVTFFCCKQRGVEKTLFSRDKWKLSKRDQISHFWPFCKGCSNSKMVENVRDSKSVKTHLILEKKLGKKGLMLKK